jgi:hypothetical protein
MASKITPQQRDDLHASHGQPVAVEDDQEHKVYYLVGADYLHTSHEQLKALIQEGINANHVPAEEAESELRRYADRLASKRA